MSKERKKPLNVGIGEMETNTSPIPVALYVRAACFTQAILDAQCEALERYAAQNNMRVVRRYVEGGLPGTMRDDLLKTITSGKADFTTIVMRDISRWGRGDMDVTVYYEYLCRQAGIDVRYVEGGQNEGDVLDRSSMIKAIGSIAHVCK